MSSYGGKTLSGEMFLYLSELYNVSIRDINTPGWEIVVDGCATCGHGREEEIDISIENVQLSDCQIENNAPALLIRLQDERAQEEREEAEYRKRLDDERREQRREEDRKKTLDRLMRDSEIIKFMDNEEEIFNLIYNFFQAHKTLEKRQFALLINDNPSGDCVQVKVTTRSAILFHLYNTANKIKYQEQRELTQTECRAIFDKFAEKEGNKRSLIKVLQV